MTDLMRFMRGARLVAVLVAGLALAACANNYDVAGTRALPTKGGAFNDALKQKYADFVSWEQQEGDWYDAIPYLKKAQAAANGETPAIDAGGNAVLKGQHDQVVAFIAAHKASDPVRAATAQVAFDCVNHEVVENVHPDGDAHGCRKLLADALGAPAPAKPVISTALPAPFIVYFDFNKSAITADGEATIKDAVAAIAKYKPGHVILEGNTDTVGSAPYNQVLSQKRADVVDAEVTKLGVKTPLEEKAYGKTHLKVATPDQTKEPRNRRVEIHLEQ